ncbi:MAG: lysine biosynthesis protein LysX [Candidatus Lokiarchaeota archaeon]|nr:lysine biosynthesis protein LysX [Candidatus Lokiarchaeota archaeon]
MKRIGILYDRLRWYEKSIIQAAAKKGFEVIKIDAKDISIDITRSDNDFDENDVILQRCISYYRGLYLTAILESEGALVINPFHVSQTCGNKLLATMALKKANVPTPRTIMAFTPESAFKAIKEIGYPAIVKPIVGSWGHFIAPVNEDNIAKAIIEHRESMSPPLGKIYYIQEEVKRSPTELRKRDIRSFVIGDEVVAAIYRVAKEGEFITNTSRGGKALPCEVDSEIEEISIKAAEAVGGGVLGVDLMESPDGYVCHEVNHVMEFRNTVEVTGIPVHEKIVDYLIEQVKK